MRRLEAAREARQRVIAGREEEAHPVRPADPVAPAAEPPPQPDGFGEPADSWERRLSEAREKREKVLALKRDQAPKQSASDSKRTVQAALTKMASRPIAALPPQATGTTLAAPGATFPDLPPLARSPEADSAGRPRRTGGYLAAAALCLALLAGIVALAVSEGALVGILPASDPPQGTLSGPVEPLTAPIPEVSAAAGTALADMEIVIVAAEGAPDIADRLGAAPSEVRVTPFAVAETSVHYFHERDADAALQVATRLGGEAVDLTGFQPPQPEGKLAIYLAGGGATP